MTGKITANFSWEEFACKSGAPFTDEAKRNIPLVCEELEKLRTHLGGNPVRITSGFRSAAHNATIKNSGTTSRHITAEAADIRVDGYTPKEVADAIEELITSGVMRQGGLGRYSTFTHYDIRGRRARW